MEQKRQARRSPGRPGLAQSIITQQPRSRYIRRGPRSGDQGLVERWLCAGPLVRSYGAERQAQRSPGRPGLAQCISTQQARSRYIRRGPRSGDQGLVARWLSITCAGPLVRSLLVLQRLGAEAAKNAVPRSTLLY